MKKRNRSGPARKQRRDEPDDKRRPLGKGERVLAQLADHVAHGTVLDLDEKCNRMSVLVDGDEPEGYRIFDFQIGSELVQRTTIIDEIAELNKEL